MTESITSLIEAAAALVQALSWPLIVFFILPYFRKPLSKFLSDLGEFTIKAGASGLEASAKLKQIEAAALLGAASTKSTGTTGEHDQPVDEKVRQIANLVSRNIQPERIRTLAETSILWVDDIPSNNLYERRALETLGINVIVSTSTDDALRKMQLKRPDVIISDMGRPQDPRADYTLLKAIRETGDSTPYIIYASSNLPEHKAEARSMGALNSTNDPQELFELVLSSIHGAS